MDAETLEWLIEGEAESMQLDVDRGSLRVTPEVSRVVDAYTEALEASLTAFLRQSGRTAEQADALAWELMTEGDAAYAVLMTLRGEGVGIWDGRWDAWFSSDEIEKLKAHLKRELGGYADDAGTGSLNDALRDAALEAAGEIEPSNGMRRNRRTASRRREVTGRRSRRNPRGVYAELGLGAGDYVIWRHGLSKRFFVDRVGPGGTKTLVGHARGYDDDSEAISAAMQEAWRRGQRDGLIFTDEGEPIGEFHNREFWPAEDGLGQYVENPPTWVVDEDIWDEAKASVEETGAWERYDDPWAVVTHVYKRMGGRIRSSANARPPPPRRRKRRSDTMHRIRRMQRQHARERFEPEIPPARYARPHHFAVNRQRKK